jgi:phosphoadenosine phosphosulfate reductase
MYDIEWDRSSGGILLCDTKGNGILSQIRPVFHEELDLLHFDSAFGWQYPRCIEPLLWASGGRKYYYRGELVAELVGGDLFRAPSAKNVHQGLTLSPVDVEEMKARNSPMLQGLVQRSLKLIWQSFSWYSDSIDIAAVAFSGGKDSLATLDLVQRALEPSQFCVVFGDTGMEIRDTYDAVNRAKARWPHLSFHSARSSRNTVETWRELGPPSRIHRWCCSVHKSVPTLLLLRELVGKESARALIFDGVRNDESPIRASYGDITVGGKHRAQINISPILFWNSGEVFLYLLSRNLLLNDAYRKGAVRVGCAVCPMAGPWWDVIGSRAYADDLSPLLNEIRSYGLSAGVPKEKLDEFVREGGWKRRAGGRFLEKGGNRILEQREDSSVFFTLRAPSEDWCEWAKTLGRVTRSGPGQGLILRDGMEYPFSVAQVGSNAVIEVEGLARADRFVLSAFRAVALKATYCVHCQACQVECPVGALRTQGKVTIGDGCTSCGLCLDMHGEACLAAKSLVTSGGGVHVGSAGKKSLQTYQHFGLRKEWLVGFLSSPREWVSSCQIGNRQFDAALRWLNHAGLIEGSFRSPTVTRLGEILTRHGADSLLTWAVIWTNLARKSAVVSWYLDNIRWGATYEKSELIDTLEDAFPLSDSTRKNAISALSELMQKSPIGEGLGMASRVQSGRRPFFLKKGWEDPIPLAILYSLYKYAEWIERYELTVHELLENADGGPYHVFGIAGEHLKRILRGLAQESPLIRVDIIRDLDNIYLDSERTPLDVIELA